MASSGEHPRDQLRQRMQELRSQLPTDVDQVVQSAQKQLDWRFQVRRHPMAALLASSTLGFLLAPRRSLGKSSQGAAYSGRTPEALVNSAVERAPQVRAGLIGLVTSPTGQAALRALFGYAVSKFTEKRPSAASNDSSMEHVP